MENVQMTELARLIGQQVRPNVRSDKFEIYGEAKEIMSLDYILVYLERNFPFLTVSSVRPFSFTIGSNNHNEGIENVFQMNSCLFFGNLNVCINPNGVEMEAEKIEIKYRSYFNQVPFIKTITRMVEIENYINEASVTAELFDNLDISQQSTAYDFYLTFLGFKIDYQ